MIDLEKIAEESFVDELQKIAGKIPGLDLGKTFNHYKGKIKEIAEKGRSAIDKGVGHAHAQGTAAKELVKAHLSDKNTQKHLIAGGAGAVGGAAGMAALKKKNK